MEKFKILQELQKCDIEIQTEKMLLEKTKNGTNRFSGYRDAKKPSIYGAGGTCKAQ